jgi:hypothetical protein
MCGERREIYLRISGLDEDDYKKFMSQASAYECNVTLAHFPAMAFAHGNAVLPNEGAIQRLAQYHFHNGTEWSPGGWPHAIPDPWMHTNILFRKFNLRCQ